MHVLYASHRYHPVPGGTERLVQTIAEGAAKRGHEVTVVTQREPGAPFEEVIGGVRVVRLRVVRAFGIRWPRDYISFLRRSRADVFHAFGNRIWCVDFYLPRARGFRWPQLLSGLGFYQYAMHPNLFDRLYFERYFPRAARRFDRYVALTDREADQMTRWGFPRERILRLPTGVDLSEFAAGAPRVDVTRAAWGLTAPQVAVYAGGFFDNKRVDRLIQAAALRRGSWGVVLIGRDMPESPCSIAATQALASRLGVEVRFPGVLPRAAVIQSLFAADAVVLGSEYEGYGLLLLEAMAAGRPFVSFDAGAAPELASTGAGFSVSSVEEFAGRLELLEDSAVRTQVGSLGLRRVTEFSQDRLVDRHLEAYQALIQDRSRG